MLKKILIGVPLALIGFVFLLLALLTMKPGWFLNVSTLKWANEKFLPAYHVDWDHLHTDVHMTAWGEYRVAFDGADFCVRSQPVLTACFQKLQVSAHLSVFSSPHVVAEKLIAQSNQIEVHLMSADEPPEPAPLHLSTLARQIYGAFQSALASLEKFTSKNFCQDDFNVDLKNISLYQDDVQTTLHLFATPKALILGVQRPDLNIQADLKRPDAHRFFFAGPLHVQLSALQLQSDLQVGYEKDQLNLRLENNLHLKVLKKPVAFQVRYDSSAQKARLSVTNAHLAVSKFKSQGQLDACTLTVNLEVDEQESPFHCTAKAQASFRLNNYKREYTLQADVTGGLQNSLLFDDERRDILHTKMNITSPGQKVVLVSGEVAAHVFHAAAGFGFDLDNLQARLEVPSFQDFETAVTAFGYFIPAPFHAMQGHLLVTAENFKRRPTGGFEIPFQADVALDKGKFNAANVTLSGTFTRTDRSAMSLDLNALIRKLHIYLPQIDPIRGLPQVQKDARIKADLAPPPKPATIPFQFNIDVKTASNKSIRIYYYLLKPYLEFGVQAHVGKAISFELHKGTQRTDIQYLRRVLELVRLNLEKKYDAESPDLDVRVKYKISGYDVFLDVQGATAQPALLLSSEPPLPRDDVVSLLLFGRPSDRLAPFQKESVGSTQAAITDRALGLFSIWAFASTPIQSVSYDPAKGVYSANVALSDDLQLNIGTNWDQVNQLSLRKHLTDGWSAVTSYEPGDVDQQDKSDFLIKKEISY